MATSYVDYILRMRDRVTGKLKGVSAEAQRADNNVKGLQSSLTSFVAIAGAAFGASQLMKYGGELQKVEKSFEVLTGSTEKANELLNGVSEYAKNTNFGKMGLAQSAKDLLTYGVAADKVLPQMEMLGDIALGDQEKLRLLSYAYAQVQGAGKLMGQDLLQLINSGFNPLQIISEQTGKSMGELRDMMSKGAISAEMVTKAMEVATSAGGRFYKGALALADTGVGRFDRMTETAFEMAQVFGKDLLDSMRPVFDMLTGIFEWVTRNKDAVILATTVVGTLAIGFGTLTAAARAYMVVQKLLNIVMTANPIGIIIMLIAALAVGIYTAYQRFEGFRKVLHGSWAVIKKIGLALWEYLQKPLEAIKKVISMVVDYYSFLWDVIKKGLQMIGQAVDINFEAPEWLKKVQDTYNKGAEGASGGNSETSGGLTGMLSGVMPNFMDMMGGAGKDTSLKSGVDSIVGRAPKTFNITIQKMTGIETLHTENIKEGVTDLEAQIKRVLLNALNDAQNLAIS